METNTNTQTHTLLEPMTATMLGMVHRRNRDTVDDSYNNTDDNECVAN